MPKVAEGEEGALRSKVGGQPLESVKDGEMRPGLVLNEKEAAPRCWSPGSSKVLADLSSG